MDRDADPLVERFRKHHLPRLRELYAPQLVLVFGSRARGDALAESDLDLVLVSERFRDEPFVLRATTVLTDLDLPFGADILCYTPEEFARKREELGIVSAAIEEGFRLV
jgi:uncharacterized protein